MQNKEFIYKIFAIVNLQCTSECVNLADCKDNAATILVHQKGREVERKKQAAFVLPKWRRLKRRIFSVHYADFLWAVMCDRRRN